MGADVLWAVVDAGRRNRDTGAQLARLGRALPVGAIAVTGTQDTSEPAAVLELGLPVAVLEGRPATAGAWTGVLTDAMDRDDSGAVAAPPGGSW